MTANWATPTKTWADNNLVSASDMNTEVRDRMDFLYGLPGARVFNSANISLTNATWTLLTFDTERYDTSNIHSIASNTDRLTVPVAGKYLIIADVIFSTVASGRRGLRFKLNGTSTVIAQILQDVGSGGYSIQNLTTIYQLAANDYVTVEAYDDGGAGVNATATANYSPEFMIQMLAG